MQSILVNIIRLKVIQLIWHDKTWTLNGIFLWGGGDYCSRMAMNNMFIRKKSMIYCFGKFGVTFLPPDKERVL